MSALHHQATNFVAVALGTVFLAACAAPTPLAPPVASKNPSPIVATMPAALTTRIPGLRDLTGMHQPEILAMLGKPDLKRLEPPAELWQYRAADCVLNLFFYREQDGYRLAHAEAWQRNLTGSSTAAQCRDENAPLKAHFVQSQL